MTNCELALEVIRKLQESGHQALLAGGCVRDQLMSVAPKDYDVATSANPDQVQELFGRRRTLAIGKSFGVITVLGPKEAGQIEVATFRKDGGYSDGRRPDSVSFTDACNDALRRDFTINGMYFDPVTNQVHDYVNGQADLDAEVIRAIGDPEKRIEEDKLRMLRAVRFTARFGFALEAETAAAIRRHAREIRQVSGERIGAEMRRMMEHESRADAARLLVECGLLSEILDGAELLTGNRANWKTRLKWLKGLGNVTFEVAATVLLGPVIKEYGIDPVALRWKLSNAEQDSIFWMENNWVTLMRAASLPWSEVQPLLIHADVNGALQIAEVAGGADQVGVKFCQKRLEWPQQKLDPLPLVDGATLKEMGLQPGPEFGRILSAVRGAQLDGKVATKEQAIGMVREMQM